MRNALKCIVTTILITSFATPISAYQNSYAQGVIQCMRSASCGGQMFLVRVDDSIPGLLLRVASYRSVRDEILLTDDWVAVRKVVNDDGEGITLIFDYNFDGTIDAVQFSHEKSPITNLREAGNMSKEEKTKLQSYFNGVMASAYFLKILKDETEKNRPAR